MIRKIFVASVFVLAVAASQANAGDAAMRWDGGYAGVHVGGISARTQAQDIAFSADTALKGSSVIGGALAGINFVNGNFLSGFEVDIGFASAGDSDPVFQIESKLKWAGNGRLRAGFIVDRTLFFVAGGLSFANIEQAAFGFSRQSYFAYGLTIGAGIETYLQPNWLFRVEYLYTGYHRFDQTYSNLGEQVTTTVETQIVRAALIHKFGDGKPAQQTNYSGKTDWSGAYFGGHAGRLSMREAHLTDIPGITFYQDNVSVYDVWGGGLAGINFQRQNWVFGFEIDFGLGNLDGFDNQGLVVAKLRWDAHIRARIGYAFDKYLVFMTTGVALAQLQQQVLGDPPGTTNLTGYMIGAGFDMMLSPNFVFRVEYLHSRFETNTVIHVDSGAIFDTDLVTNTVRAAIIYKYSGSGFGDPAVRMPTSTVNWTGMYVGGFAGSQMFRPHIEVDNQIDDFNARGPAYGLLLGFNYQVRNWVLGVEVDAGWSDAKIKQFSACLCNEVETKMLIDTHWRARVGYAFDRYLAFVSGGIAVAQFQQDTTGLGIRKRAHTGFTWGGGIDAALTNNLFARVEYIYSEYGLQNYNYYNADPIFGPMADSSYKTQTWRAAVIYKFD